MNRVPEVSVVMSIYNGERYLREAIESILNQTFTDFEFIIINDGSTDRSAEILRSYDDDRIVLIDNGDNIGLTKSLNKGIEMARGKYIARMDADDISLPERLERQVTFLDRHPDVVLLGTSSHTIDENGQIVETHYPPLTSHQEIYMYLLFDNPLAHSTTIFRTYVVKQLGGYDENIIYAQDYDLWWRMSQVGRVEILSEVLNCWRRNLTHGISYTKGQEQKLFAEEIALRAVRGFMDGEPFNEAAYLRLLRCVQQGECTQWRPQDARMLAPFWQRVREKAGLSPFLMDLWVTRLGILADQGQAEGLLLLRMLCKCFGKAWWHRYLPRLFLESVLGSKWTHRIRRVKRIALKGDDIFDR